MFNTYTGIIEDESIHVEGILGDGLNHVESKDMFIHFSPVQALVVISCHNSME